VGENFFDHSRVINSGDYLEETGTFATLTRLLKGLLLADNGEKEH
jgi:hypothetical protein